MTETEKLILEKLENLDKKMTETQAATERKLESLDKKMTETQLLIENEIGKKINIIGEGHDFLKMRLEEALQMEKKRERMELDIVDLRIENLAGAFS